MGLLSDAKYGAKAQLMGRCPAAFFDAPTLAQAARGAARPRTVAVVDGNILAHQLHAGDSKTFDDYCGLVSHVVRCAARAAHLVVVAYDEPRAVTLAKREEQDRREARKVPGEWTRGDAYSVADLDRMADVVPVVQCRRARMRCIDEVAARSLRAVRGDGDAAGGSLEGLCHDFRGAALVYDGVDVRGATRAPLSVRVPAQVASDDRVCACRPTAIVGEADLKLAAIVRTLDTQGEHDVALVVTVDTDSICIELLEMVRKAETPTLPRVICARQRAKRDRAGAVLAPAHYQCVDVRTLYDGLLTAAWGAPRTVAPTRDQQRRTIVLCVVGLALCGCDFVRLQGLRADIVLDTVVHFRHDGSPADATGVWGDADDVLGLAPLVNGFVDACAARLAAMPRMRRQCGAVRQRDPAALLRGLWTTAYWGTNELRELNRFGFGVRDDFDVHDTLRWMVDSVCEHAQSDSDGTAAAGDAAARAPTEVDGCVGVR